MIKINAKWQTKIQNWKLTYRWWWVANVETTNAMIRFQHRIFWRYHWVFLQRWWALKMGCKSQKWCLNLAVMLSKTERTVSSAERKISCQEPWKTAAFSFKTKQTPAKTATDSNASSWVKPSPAPSVMKIQILIQRKYNNTWIKNLRASSTSVKVISICIIENVLRACKLLGCRGCPRSISEKVDRWCKQKRFCSNVKNSKSKTKEFWNLSPAYANTKRTCTNPSNATSTK